MEINNDFGPEDRGRYRHPETIGEYSYADLEQKVLNAIDARYRTLMRIKEHAGLDRSFDLTDVIVGMELDKIIGRHSNGTITAFFRHAQRPQRFWLEGDGRVGAEFEEAANKKPSSSLKNHGPRDTTALFANPKDSVRNFADIDVNHLEDLASVCRDSKHVAVELGIAWTTLLKELQKPILQAAFDRGRDKYRNTQKPKQETSKSIEKSTTETGEKTMQTETTQTSPDTRRKGINYTPELFRNAAAEGLSQNAFSRRLGLKSSGAISYQYANNPELKAAWDEGVREYQAKNGNGSKPPAKKTQLVKTSPPPARTVPESVQEQPASATTKSISHRHLTFAAGGQVLIGFEGNFFNATPDERRFLNRLAEMFEAYPNA